MKTLLIGSDFMYDKDGVLKPIEINTATGWHKTKFESDADSLDLSGIESFVSNNGFTKIVYIGNIRPVKVRLVEFCSEKGIEFEIHNTNSNSVTIPYIEDNDTTLIIRSSYDTTALVDDIYCRDKVNFLNLIKDSSFGSQFVYIDDNDVLVNNITTINDNGEHPNFILKSRLSQYDKELYPKFYKVSTQEELNELIQNVVTSDYFLMEFYLNSNELIENHIKVYRGLNLLFPPNLESISLGGYTRVCEDSISEPSTFDSLSYELTSNRGKYLSDELPTGLPKLLDTDLVQLSDGTYKIATELVVGDLLKTIDIPNPFNVDDSDDTSNYKITLSELQSGTTYSTNAITAIRRINTLTDIIRITFTDGSNWFDNPSSRYLSIRDNEVRFLTFSLPEFSDEYSIIIGDSILLLDTTNEENPVFILKEISNIEFTKEFFGGYEITVERAHLFLTKSDVDSDKSYVSIEHNVGCSPAGCGEFGGQCQKSQICCPSSNNCTSIPKCPQCAKA